MISWLPYKGIIPIIFSDPTYLSVWIWVNLSYFTGKILHKTLDSRNIFLHLAPQQPIHYDLRI